MRQIPRSSRPQATLAQLRDMGPLIVVGDRVVVAMRMGYRTEWRRQLGSDWYERIDEAAPVAPEHRAPAHGDPREEQRDSGSTLTSAPAPSTPAPGEPF